MAETIYLSKSKLSELLRKRFNFESVEFGHDEEFLADESEGVIALCERMNGEEFEDTLHYLDLRDAVAGYVEELELEFCGWRLFTRSEGFGAVLLVKRR